MRPFLVLLLAAARYHVSRSGRDAADGARIRRLCHRQDPDLCAETARSSGPSNTCLAAGASGPSQGKECRDGYWYEDGRADLLCLRKRPDPQCWLFWQDTSGLSARFAGDPDGRRLSEVESATSPADLRRAGCRGLTPPSENPRKFASAGTSHRHAGLHLCLNTHATACPASRPRPNWHISNDSQNRLPCSRVALPELLRRAAARSQVQPAIAKFDLQRLRLLGGRPAWSPPRRRRAPRHSRAAGFRR